MKPGLGFVTWILVAGAVHALVLLLPRPAGQAGEGIPTIELTLEDSGPGQPGMLSLAPRAAPPAVGSRTVSVPAPQAAAPAADPVTPEQSPPVEPGVQAAPAGDTVQPPDPGVAVVAGPDAAAAPIPAEGSPAETGGSGASGSPTGGGGASGGRTADAVSAAVTPPRPRTKISPAYPRSARASGAQGTVRIMALIDDSGAVISAEVSTSSGTDSLDRAALEEVRRTSFQPAVQRGKPFICWVIIPIRFQLK